MDLKEKVITVAHCLHNAAFNAPKMGGVDNLEDPELPVDNPDGSAMVSFLMTEFVSDPPEPGHRGPGGGRPRGELHYRVTVVVRWVPYDDG